MSDDNEQTSKFESKGRKTLWEQFQDGTITKKDYAREINRQSYQRNKVQVRKRRLEWRANNPEANRAIQTRARNKLKEAGYFQRWEKNNTAKRRSYTWAYRQRQKRATPPWLTAEHWAEMQVFYDEARRLTQTTGTLHVVDHIWPLNGPNSCGLHVPWNLQVITQAENDSKGASNPT